MADRLNPREEDEQRQSPSADQLLDQYHRPTIEQPQQEAWQEFGPQQQESESSVLEQQSQELSQAGITFDADISPSETGSLEPAPAPNQFDGMDIKEIGQVLKEQGIQTSEELTNESRGEAWEEFGSDSLHQESPEQEQIIEEKG